MDQDYSQGTFLLRKYSLPCCNTSCTLHELVYDWPQGFGRFAFDARNPNIGEISKEQKREIEVILGTHVRIIYRHM